MKLTRRNLLVYLLLAGVWAVVVVWQIQEHVRVKNYAKANLRNRAKDIAKTMSSFIQGLQYRGTVFSDRLQPVLDRLVGLRATEVDRSGEVLSVVLLNAAGDPVAKAGNPIDLNREDLHQEGERWGRRSLIIAYPVAGVSVAQEGVTSPARPVLLVDPPTNGLRGPMPRRTADS